MSAAAAFCSQFRAFTLAHCREALRDRRGLTMLLSTFGGLIALLLAMELLFGGGLLRVAIPVVALVGFLSLALVSTAVPLVAARQAGALRQFAMTPARRGAFVLGHVPMRCGIGILQLAVLLGLIALTGPPAGALPRVAALLLAGLLMLLALGYLLGGLLSDPDRAMQLSYALPFVLLVASGALFPFALLPDPWGGIMERSLGYLPTSLLATGLRAELGDAPATLSLSRTIAVLLGATLILAALTVRTFRWSGGRPDHT